MAARTLGTRVLRYSEQIAHRFIPGSGDWSVYADRTAELSPDLTEVSTRRLVYIRVVSNDLDLDLPRDVAYWLRGALTEALNATEDLG